MFQGKSRGRDRGAHAGKTRSRPHHISAIAHHFLEPAEQDPSPDRSRAGSLAVAGTGHGQVIAWACGAMIRGMSSREVQFTESQRLHWSALSHLQDLVPAGASSAGGPVRDEARGPRFQSLFPGPSRVSSGNQSCSRTAGRSEPFPVRNLGNLNDRQLNLLEVAQVVPGAEGWRLPDCGALAWCLEPAEVGSLSSFYTLSRALGLLAPTFLEIIVVDQSCFSPAWSEQAVLDPDAVERCREAVTGLVGPGQVRLTVLSPVKGAPPPDPGRLLEKLGQKISGPDDSD